MPTTNLPDITSSTQIVTTTTSSPHIPSCLHQAVRTRPREDAKGADVGGGVTEGVRLCGQEVCH